MKKALFLDLDGVHNVEVFINACYAICKKANLNYNEQMRDKYGMLFCPTTINQLEYIIKETGADIVISSTWRYSGLSVMQAMWKDRGLPGSVIGVTPILRIHNDEGSFKERAERGREIAKWLSENKVDAYCIIDDDNDCLPEQEKYFIQTDAMYGLTHKHALKAIEILNNED